MAANGNSDASPMKRNKSFTEILGHNLTFNVKHDIFEDSHVKSMEQYREMHKKSVEDPEGFWTEIAKQFYQEEKWTGKFMEYNFVVRKDPKQLSLELFGSELGYRYIVLL